MESHKPNLQRINSTSTSKDSNWVIISSGKEGRLASGTRAGSRTTVSYRLSSLLKPLLRFLSLPAAALTLSFSPCKWLSLSSSRFLSLAAPSSLSRKVTVTLFGFRHGHVSLTIQEQPWSDPVLIIQLAISTSALVREMSSGHLRIALECEKRARGAVKLFHEPKWTVYCNSRKCGYANPREGTGLDLHVLCTIRNVSVGAGVIPMIGDDDGGGRSKKGGGSGGELLYMRAKFERVVGNQDSEAYYMLNPDGNGGPELSIFLLRI
ncbi:hypothetical protein MLD38_028802 [Melastoma candidum]|uniref:Uncharacterized protein n=1 Tax=Melastoma candidum TaxID=119954 RepID=A0ACB9N262_9MYRT|nr:hypothetical protein MLD38_028802 [Melastoma candidum]